MTTHDPRATQNQPRRRPWAVTCGDLSGELETMTYQGVLMKCTDTCLQLRDAGGSGVPVRPVSYHQEMLTGATDA